MRHSDFVTRVRSEEGRQGEGGGGEAGEGSLSS